MHKKILAIHLLSIILILIPSCVSSQNADISVHLTAADSGAGITLHEGQLLKVSLKGNVSTGYIWEVVPGAEPILIRQGDIGYVPDSDHVGAPGIYTYTFKAVSSGSTTIEHIYHRPWETGVLPLQTFQVKITVEK
jgi:inhibitor of cysteine peptidase